ncbi:hypothetical protein B0H12DRAFT_1232141 [Mycena haematopus]|nr:hypothetical protein B0H12DRAFT_1232141 [Mycena haematopus]
MDRIASFDANTTLGAVQIGVLVSYVLFGVATTQSYIYFSRFPDDPRRVKALTAFVWACDVANIVCLGHVLYTFTITDYAHPERLDGPPPRSLSVSTLFSGFTAACVQGFFAFRIYTFTKKMYIPGLVWFLAFLHLLGRIVLFATTLHTPSLGTYVTQWEWLITTNWGISVANDVVLTTTLVFVLHGHRSNAHRQTAALVDRLIVWTIETGMLTSASSSIMLACFVTRRENYVWLAFYAIRMESPLASLRTTDTIYLESVTPSNGPPANGVHVKTMKHVSYAAHPPRKIPDAV